MSGGELNYIFGRVNDAAYEIEQVAKRQKLYTDNSVMTKLYFKVAERLKIAGEVLHDIEWVLSGDYGEGDEIESIIKFLDKEDLKEFILD